MRRLAEEMVEALVAGGRFGEAALLESQHLQDADSAVAHLAQVPAWL